MQKGLRQRLCDRSWIAVYSLAALLLPASCTDGQVGTEGSPDAAADLSLPTNPMTDGGMDTGDLPGPDMSLPPAEGKPLWGRYYGATSTDVAVATDGSIYMTGSFYRADFGDGPITASGERDVYLIKFDKFGQRLWARTFGRAYIDVPNKLAVDGSGNVVVVGYSLRTAAADTHDAFVTYYTSDGTQRYFQIYGGPSTTAVDTARTVAFAKDGSSFYVAGGFEDRINFGGGDLISAGGRDIYLLQLRADKSYVSAKRWGFTDYDQASSISILPDGDLLLTGTGGYPIDFGDGMVGTETNVDTFLVRFSPQFAVRWSKRFRVVPSSGVVTIAAPDGTLWLAGDTNIAIDFGGGPLTSSTGRGLFSTHYSASGGYLGAFIIPSTRATYLNSIAIDASGQLILGGEAGGDVDFGFGLTTNADGNAFFLKQAPTGQVRWVHRFGGTSSDEVSGVAVSPFNDQVLAVGFISQNVKLGTVNLSPTAFVLDVTP